MLARPRIDLHTLAVDFCLFVDDELARGHSDAHTALRRSSRATRENLARMCRTVDETERMVFYERARDACARASAALTTLHRARRVDNGRHAVGSEMLTRLMDRILELAMPATEEGRA